MLPDCAKKSRSPTNFGLPGARSVADRRSKTVMKCNKVQLCDFEPITSKRYRLKLESREQFAFSFIRKFCILDTRTGT